MRNSTRWNHSELTDQGPLDVHDPRQATLTFGAVAEADDRLDRGTKLALAAMALGVFVIANDFTALSVAIPNIESDLHTTLAKSQWVINGYALVFGVLIVTGGRLADLFGRKRVFVIGAVIFATFSVLAGLMPNVGLLIACRGLMGIGGALMWPAILGMTYALLPDSRAGLAGGLILGVAGLGNAVGPLLGGVLTDELSWRWVFFINLPVAAFAIWVTQREVTESTVGVGTRHIDYTGVGVLTAGVVAILLALDQGTGAGFTDPAILALFSFGALALVVFVIIERGQGEGALVPSSVMRVRVFAGACLTVLLMSAIFFAALLYLPQFMVRVLGFTALESGAGLLPMMGVFAVMSFVAGSLYGRLGPRVVLTLGAAALAGGMFVLSRVDSGSDYTALVPGMIVLGAGVGLFYSSITTLAVTSLDPDRASLAGGIVYMCQIAGGAVGLGVNTAIVTSGSNIADGISTAFFVDAVLAVAGLVLVQVVVGAAPHDGEDTPHPHALRWRHRVHA
jgi:EmrB/QacA subfamily drug resistance transporter